MVGVRVVCLSGEGSGPGRLCSSVLYSAGALSSPLRGGGSVLEDGWEALGDWQPAACSLQGRAGEPGEMDCRISVALFQYLYLDGTPHEPRPPFVFI